MRYHAACAESGSLRATLSRRCFSISTRASPVYRKRESRGRLGPVSQTVALASTRQSDRRRHLQRSRGDDQGEAQGFKAVVPQESTDFMKDLHLGARAEASTVELAKKVRLRCRRTGSSETPRPLHKRSFRFALTNGSDDLSPLRGRIRSSGASFVKSRRSPLASLFSDCSTSVTKAPPSSSKREYPRRLFLAPFRG